MKALSLLIVFSIVTSAVHAEWSAKLQKGEHILSYKKNTGEAPSPQFKELETLIASESKKAPFNHINFGDYLEHDQTIQKELMAEFETTYPTELKAALNSAGNSHNPKVIPLRKLFSACLLKTPSVIKIDTLFRKQGYKISRISHEKFHLDKSSELIKFKAITWLMIDSIAEPKDKPKN